LTLLADQRSSSLVVVFVFLRRIYADDSRAGGLGGRWPLAGLPAPGGLWLAGFLDRQSVADGAGDLSVRLRGSTDAIVMIEKQCTAISSTACGPYQAALEGRGSRSVFTVLSISLSLIRRVFTPLIFMDGIVRAVVLRGIFADPDVCESWFPPWCR